MQIYLTYGVDSKNYEEFTCDPYLTSISLSIMLNNAMFMITILNS